MGSLVELAKKILHNAEMIESSTRSNPEGATKKASHIPPIDVDKARVDLLDAAHQINRKAQGPESSMYEMMWSVTDVLVLNIIYTHKLHQYIPLAGSISYEAIAGAAKIDERILTRFFRYAVTLGIFTELEGGHVAHTDVSRMLVENPLALDAMGMILEELGPASINTIEALRRYPGSEEPNETGYNVANHTRLSIYEFLAQNPDRARRFGAAMKFFTSGKNMDANYLIKSYPWQADDREDFVVVDVGGGQGGVSIKIAEETKNMRFIVQDREGVCEVGRSSLPEDLKRRFEFMAYDFFTPQAVKDADVYFFRWIFHNWSDKYCIKILKNLVPAMKAGAKILIYEHVLDEGVEMRLSHKGERYLDLFMLCAYNSYERTETDWTNLFIAADARFKFEGVTRVSGAALSLIQATWKE